MGQHGPITTDAEVPDDGPSTQDADRARDARWVRAAVAGDRDAFGQLYDAWFDRVFALVERVVRDPEVAAEVAQDAFLSAWRTLAGLEDPGAFGGWLLRIARNAAYNRSTRESRSRPVDDQGLAVIEGTGASPVSAPTGFGVETDLARHEDPETAAADGEIVALVRETVAALGSRDAEVLDLQLRYHLTPAEIGEVVGLNRNAANQLCHRARGKFATAFGVRLLWNGARPACPQLDALLRSSGVDAFGPEAVKLGDKHAKTCSSCDERRQLRLQPSALFAAVPLLVAPALLKVRVASALDASGVPMHGSSALSSSAAPGPGPSSSAPGSSPGSATTGSGAPAGPGPTDPGPSSDGEDGTGGGRRTRRLALVGGGVVLLVAALVGVLALTGDDEPTTDELVLIEGTTTSAEPEPSSTTTASDAVVPDVTPPPLAPDLGTTTPGADVGPGSGPDAVSDGPEPAGDQQPHDPGGAVAPPPPSSAPMPPPVIATLSLAPATEQQHTYTVGSTSPNLVWATSGATSVTVWVWFTDGQHPAQPLAVVATQASGSLRVCPGTRVGTQCTSDPGRYSYVVEATNAEGITVFSDRVDRPGFEVLPTPG